MAGHVPRKDTYEGAKWHDENRPKPEWSSPSGGGGGGGGSSGGGCTGALLVVLIPVTLIVSAVQIFT